MAAEFINLDILVDYVVNTMKEDGAKVTKKQAREVLETSFEGIEGFLAEGYEVKLTKFAKFSVRPTKERTGRNPQTGELITIPASHRVSISPLGTLKGLAKTV